MRANLKTRTSSENISLIREMIDKRVNDQNVVVNFKKEFVASKNEEILTKKEPFLFSKKKEESFSVFDSKGDLLEKIEGKKKEEILVQEQENVNDSFNQTFIPGQMDNNSISQEHSEQHDENIFHSDVVSSPDFLEGLSASANSLGLTVNRLTTTLVDDSGVLSETFENAADVSVLVTENNAIAEKTLEDVKSNISVTKVACIVVGVAFVAGLIGVTYKYKNFSLPNNIPTMETSTTETVKEVFGIEYAKDKMKTIIERKFLQ